MQKGLIRKGLVLSVIVLFIGVSIATGITVKLDSLKNLQTDEAGNELVEIPVQIHRANCIENHKIWITQQQADELDTLIEEFKSDLDKSHDIDETIKIYKEMVVSLNEIDLLPKGLSVNELQDLVTSRIYKPNNFKFGNLALHFLNHLYKVETLNEIKTIENDDTTSYGDIYENNNCFLSFYATNTDMYLTLSPSDLLKLLIFMFSGIILGKIFFDISTSMFFVVAIIILFWGVIILIRFIKNTPATDKL